MGFHSNPAKTGGPYVHHHNTENSDAMHHVPRASIWSTIGCWLARWVPSCLAGWLGDGPLGPEALQRVDPGQAFVSTAFTQPLYCC